MYFNNNRKLNLNLESCAFILVLFVGGWVILLGYQLVTVLISSIIASVIYIRLGRGGAFFAYIGEVFLTTIILAGLVLMVLFSFFSPETQIMSKPLSISLAILFLIFFIIGPIKNKWLKRSEVIPFMEKWFHARCYPDFSPDWLLTPAMRKMKDIPYEEMIQIVKNNLS